METAHNHTPEPAEGVKVSDKIKKIWIVAGILALLTMAEFVIAFVMDPGMFKNVLFYGLTIVKAFYIVSEFMHLKHEVKSLIWGILIPMIFVVWLIIALRYEAWSILIAQ